MYQDLGNSVFSFINPIEDFSKTDYKTLNNNVLIDAISTFDIKAEASGRNDLEVDGKKISGSAYKLKLGRQNGSGRRSLHHGTMLINLEMDALQKYLNPNKKKLESKGVDSVVARVTNLNELNSLVDHGSFCDALEKTFAKKYEGMSINRVILDQKKLL